MADITVKFHDTADNANVSVVVKMEKQVNTPDIGLGEELLTRIHELKSLLSPYRGGTILEK